MPLKDRVILITNVEKFAGHGTTRAALPQGATVLGHDPSFEAPSARRKYETQFQGAHALSAIDPATMVELALKRHGHIDALVNNDAYPALRAPLAEARMEDYRDALEAMAVAPLRLTQLVAPSMRKRNPEWPAFVPGGDPKNPLGTRALYLSWQYYRIHGTDDARKIGRRASNGCIGLYNEQIEAVYDRAPVGTQVKLI